MRRLREIRWKPVMAVAGWMALVLAAGCQLRPLSSEEQIEMLMVRNRRLEEELLAAEQKVAELTAAGKTPMETPPTPEDPFRVIAVRFGRFTGGLDTDGAAGDERLKIVIEPLDAEGDVVKRAGRLELKAFELASETERPPETGPEQPFAQWEWSQEELAQTWLSGLGAYAYVLKLPWPGGQPPRRPWLLLRARFTTLSEEVFSAEKVIPIRPSP